MDVADIFINAFEISKIDTSPKTSLLPLNQKKSVLSNSNKKSEKMKKADFFIGYISIKFKTSKKML